MIAQIKTPRSTVRLQLHAEFTFDDAAAHVPYYASLGLSHLYLSPVTCARKDSTHGYDVIDHRRVDPQLGGEDPLRQLAQRARKHDMGLIIDIVPNHMAAHPDNPWWRSVLQDGTVSPYARWFDIQWDTARPGLRDKVLLPILANPYGTALEHGDVRLAHDGSTYALDVHGLILPLAADSINHDNDPDSVQAQLDAHEPSTRAGRLALHTLLERQHYRLAWWQCAAEQINWRRFFEISDLVGVRVEHEDVFDAVHELPLRLFEEGLIDGLRIDHVDGLAYPLSYCDKLRQALRDRIPRRPEDQRDIEPWLVVEKILARDEYLDTRWAVDGTTGYDFMEAVNTVIHDPDAQGTLDQYWSSIARDTRPVEAWRRDARALMVERHFPAEREALLEKISRLAPTGLATRDAARPSLGRALDQLLIEFSVYRTYTTLDHRAAEDAHYLDQARDAARQYLVESRDLAAASVLDFIVGWLKGRGKDSEPLPGKTVASQSEKRALLADVMRRFQQLTPPLAAKALEDTVFYRYGRLLSRNEVGSDPAVFSTSVDEFHRWNQHRAQSAPRSMNATATHDHKRGEDVRARLAVISELPHAWQDLSTRCLAALGQHRTIDCGAHSGQCYMLLQTIVGAWPAELSPDDEAGMAEFIERLQQWQSKALREAKQLTSWFYPDESYEQEQADRIEFLLCASNSATSKALAGFASRIAPAGALNSLGTAVLRCTLPGVPDLYQGTDLWDFSLVDPDNRRPVDMARRQALNTALNSGDASWSDLLFDWKSGAIKQAVLSHCLNLRTMEPGLFDRGNYVPLTIEGPLAGHLIAFSRRHDDVRLIVLVSRLGYRAAQRTGQTLTLPLIPSDLWGDTQIELPAGFRHGPWRDALAGETHNFENGRIQAGAVLTHLPVAVLVAS